MAAYAATVTPADAVAQVLAGTPLRIVRGSVNITNYNPTLAEITGITKFFRTTPTVILGGVSSNGYLVTWVAASKSIKAFYSEGAHTHVENTAATYVQNAMTAANTAAAGEEVAADVAVGSVEFVAVGIAP